MATSFVDRKPITRQGKRYLEDRAPKLIENDKNTVFIRGGKCSQDVTEFLRDVYQLKKPSGIFLREKNPIHPLVDETPLERFASKFDASLFAFGSTSKKRPKNLIFGRMYRYHLLDAFEFGLETTDGGEYESLKKLNAAPMGTKPCLSFVGEQFYNDPTYVRMRNFFVDFFRGPEVEQIRLQGLEYLLSFFAVGNGKVEIRGYKIELKKSGTRTPRVELVDSGPMCRLNLRRFRLASDDAYKTACRRPKEAKIRQTKNINRDVFGTKLGRVHVKQQPIDQLRTKKVRGLRNRGPNRTSDGGGDQRQEKSATTTVSPPQKKRKIQKE